MICNKFVLKDPPISANQSEIGCLGLYSVKKGESSIVPVKKNMVMAFSESNLNRESIQRNDSITDYKFNADAVIWMGDLNYRINGVVGAVVFSIKKNMYEVLMDNDQFSIERKIGRISHNFSEGPIYFAPTYKLNKGVDSYNVSHRIPGWTDRIIYSSRNLCLSQKSYDSNNLLKQSDHRPVFSQFELHYEFLEGFATLNRSIGHLDEMLSAGSRPPRFNEENNPDGLREQSSSSSSNGARGKHSMRSQVKEFSKDQLMVILNKKIREEKDMNASKSQGCLIF